MSNLSEGNGYRLSKEGSERLIELRESQLTYTLPDGYKSGLERDPQKALRRLQSAGFVLPKKD